VQQSTKILKWQFKNDVYNSEYFIMHKKSQFVLQNATN